MESQKLKVKITATDRIGREESLVLALDEKTALRLVWASNNTDGCRMLETNVELDLARLYDGFRYYPKRSVLSRAQFYRLKGFLGSIYTKLYNYTLSITAL